MILRNDGDFKFGTIIGIKFLLGIEFLTNLIIFFFLLTSSCFRFGDHPICKKNQHYLEDRLQQSIVLLYSHFVSLFHNE